MDANIIQIALTILVVAIIGAMKFYERKYGNNPQAWDMQKFLLFIGVAIVVMAVEYAYGNSITFPTEEILVPAMALFGVVYTLITGGKLVTNVAAEIKNPTKPDSTIYYPAQHDNRPIWDVPWETMKQWVQFRVTDATKVNMLQGVEDPADRASILAQIAKAEDTNEYKYTIDWTHGYFNMIAVCDPVNSNDYKYQVLVSESGGNRQ